jgi:multiple sugar transport system permease protein
VSAPRSRVAYVFISPWIVGFLFLTLGPILATLFLSLTDYDALPGATTSYVGLDNYREALTQEKTGRALLNTGFYALLYVPLSVTLGLALALLLRRAGRATGFFRTVIYLPVVTPPVATGVLFLLLLNGQDGLLNEVLGWLHLPTPYWTTDPSWIKPGIVIMSLWSVGSVAIILFAALGDVPTSLLEAAQLDGAGPWGRLRHVIVPMISPALFFVLVTNTIASFQLFNEVYTMYFGAQTTNPPEAALFYVVHVFEEAFKFLHMGYASALSWLLFLIIAVVTAVQLLVGRTLVFYRGDS